VIRPARPEDAEALATIQDAGWREGFTGIVEERPPLDRVRERFAERLEQGKHPLLVAEEAGAVRGFASFGDAEIHALYVDPSAWRRGTGRALLERALADLRQAGHEEVTLWSLAVNDRATVFYEANGFETDGATRARPETDNAEEIRFRRKL
jgi:ribosomal protein S18 acetylase RimI-like enzyme